VRSKGGFDCGACQYGVGDGQCVCPFRVADRHYPLLRYALPMPASSGTGGAFLLRAAAVVLDAEIVDLARDGIATDAEQLCSLNLATACRRQCAADQRALETVREQGEHL